MNTSYHAQKRQDQRNLSDEDIYFILEHGRELHVAGGIFYQMLSKSIPKDLAPNDRRRKLVGSTVLVCKCGQFVITVYRNPTAFKKDNKKAKYDKLDTARTCPCCLERIDIDIA